MSQFQFSSAARPLSPRTVGVGAAPDARAGLEHVCRVFLPRSCLHCVSLASTATFGMCSGTRCRGLKSTAPPPWTTSSRTRTSWARVSHLARQRGVAVCGQPWLCRLFAPPQHLGCCAPSPVPKPCAVNRLIDNGKLPHLLFYGPPGTGKTSTILACAKRLYGEKGWKSMTLVLNASDDRGIGVVRDQIKGFAGTKKLFSTGVKLVILDEADAMTSDAQFALRRGERGGLPSAAVNAEDLSACMPAIASLSPSALPTSRVDTLPAPPRSAPCTVIEKYTKNTRFCLICNYVSRIIPALQSRCTRFRFPPLKRSEMEARLREIIDLEK